MHVKVSGQASRVLWSQPAQRIRADKSWRGFWGCLEAVRQLVAVSSTTKAVGIAGEHVGAKASRNAAGKRSAAP